MLTIDGARGEGGGQVARLALALAAARGMPVRVDHIRTGRPQPGLKAGHVAACLALAELTAGEVEGAQVGSQTVTFRPGLVVGGAHTFAIGTAGPVTLLAQALLPALAAAHQPFDMTLSGGTDVAWSPTWENYARVHLPLLSHIGVQTSTGLVRRGFFPKGGGQVQLRVETPALHKVRLDEPGPLTSLSAVIASQGLPRHVMERAAIAVQEGLQDIRPVEVETDFHRGPGTGMSIALQAECGRSILGADAVGRKGTRVEDVVAEAVQQLRADLDARAGVDVRQADQLPVFMALAGGGSFTARRLSRHAETVLDLLPEFLPVGCDVIRQELWRVDIRPV